MKNRENVNCGILALVVAGAVTVMAENVPGWRGARGDGSTLEKNLPAKWSATENVAWKTEIPGLGHSTPIVWDDKIFLTTALEESRERAVVCLNRKDGKILWQKTVVTSPLEKKHKENSYASTTPATDGQMVYVSFLEGTDTVVVAAYDFAGNLKWKKTPTTFKSDWGFATTHVIWQDRILISCCSKINGEILALDKKTGETLWMVKSVKPGQAFSPPYIREMAGKEQMVIQGNESISSYDPQTGKELWTTAGPSKEFIATPVYNEARGILLGSSSWDKKIAVGIKPDGAGNVTESKIAWKSKDGPWISSAVSSGDYFFFFSPTPKSLNCWKAATGEMVWQMKDVAIHHASPLLTADGLIYFAADDGVVRIVKASPQMELVATNVMGENIYASPVAHDGQILLRTFKTLYCIGKK
ncbi:MAG: PQQ-binding-like beta-propeller repeat protein [bacterium]